MPNKEIIKQIQVRWTAEELIILEQARELCRECARDEDMEQWARDNCQASFWDVAKELSDFINESN